METDKEFWADVTHPVDIEPTLEGDCGEAWLCDIGVGQALMGVKPEQDATICHWVVEVPWAHPAWHSYSIISQHLRPMDGYDKAIVFHLEDATHELLVFALDPKKDRKRLIETGIVERHFLNPPNFAAQFIELDDDLARERIKSTVQEIVDGKLSPDTDYRQMWVKRFGGNMVKS
jgi:hypothetical protein